MAVLTDTKLNTLHRSTGSAHLTLPKLSQEVLCAVNAPVDVQRRDELPNEAYIDVHVRPNHGVGQVRERHLETLIQTVVKDVVLGRLWPRTAIQITLQILRDGTQELPKEKQGSYLTILPVLLNATCLALIDAGVPMRCTFSSTMVQLEKNGDLTAQPDLKTLESANSLHVLAYSSKEELLFTESEGRFSISEWEAIEDAAKELCLGTSPASAMAVDGQGLDLTAELREVVANKIQSENRWRDGG